MNDQFNRNDAKKIPAAEDPCAESAGASDIDGLGTRIKSGLSTCLKGEDDSECDSLTATTEAGSSMATAGIIHIDRYSQMYKMNHLKRGLAIIINHEKYDAMLGLNDRKGTSLDGERLQKTFTNHGFKTAYFKDPTIQEINHILKTRVTDQDHSDEDCIVIAIMTHGLKGDILYAKNDLYKLDMLCDKLTPDECPTLAGKPKIFFIQACRGSARDKGQVVYDSVTFIPPPIHFQIPTHADFFLAYSTIPNFVSFRNENDGSWFIQTLCNTLDKENSHSRSIFQLVTEVVGFVAFHKTSDSDQEKQLPQFTSRLTKDLVLGKKPILEPMAQTS